MAAGRLSEWGRLKPKRAEPFVQSRSRARAARQSAAAPTPAPPAAGAAGAAQRVVGAAGGAAAGADLCPGLELGVCVRQAHRAGVAAQHHPGTERGVDNWHWAMDPGVLASQVASSNAECPCHGAVLEPAAPNYVSFYSCPMQGVFQGLYAGIGAGLGGLVGGFLYGNLGAGVLFKTAAATLAVGLAAATLVRRAGAGGGSGSGARYQGYARVEFEEEEEGS